MDSNEHIDTNGAEPQARGSAWSRRLVTGGLAVIVVAGVGAYAATASDFGSDRMRFGMGPGQGMEMQASWRGGSHDGMGMRGHMRGGPGFGIDRMLDAIDATDEQKDRLEDIFESVRDEVRPLMREFRDSRQELARLLGAETVDSAAIETLRSGRVAAIDDATKKLTTAVLEAAEVLTPEQRATIVDHFEDRGRFRRW